jgi:hypothetical protein
MMVEHIVLFKWKEDAPGDAIQAAIDGLLSLRHKIPGIIDITCGQNFSERAQGFHTGLVVRFQDREALETYIPHHEHQHVVQNIIAPIRADVLAVDYEIE